MGFSRKRGERLIEYGSTTGGNRSASVVRVRSLETRPDCSGNARDRVLDVALENSGAERVAAMGPSGGARDGDANAACASRTFGRSERSSSGAICPTVR